MGSPVGALIWHVWGWTVGIFRGEREGAEEWIAAAAGREAGGLGSIVVSRRYYLPYTRCLCRLADSVDSRLKSRTFVCTLLSFSLARGSASSNCRERRTGRRGAKPAIAADRSLHLSKLHGAPSSGTDELIVYHNSWFHRWLITEEIGASEASLGGREVMASAKTIGRWVKPWVILLAFLIDGYYRDCVIYRWSFRGMFFQLLRRNYSIVNDRNVCR